MIFPVFVAMVAAPLVAGGAVVAARSVSEAAGEAAAARVGFVERMQRNISVTVFALVALVVLPVVVVASFAGTALVKYGGALFAPLVAVYTAFTDAVTDVALSVFGGSRRRVRRRR